MRNGLSALETALELLRRELWPLVLHPLGATIPTRDGPKIAKGKEPVGKAWGAERPTEDRLRDLYRSHPQAGVGLLLGPRGGIIDFEQDGPEGGDSLLKLFGGEPVDSLGWSSRRGPHQLFRYDERLTRVGKRVFKRPELPGLEFRFGGDGEQLQSACPPTLGEDSHPRLWNDCDLIAPLPERALHYLCAALSESNGHTSAGTGGASGKQRSRARPATEDNQYAANALQFIPPSWRDDYDQWILIGFALHHLGEAGLKLWKNWSRGSTKYEPGDCEEKWPTMDNDRPRGATLGTVYQEAIRHGWQPPWHVESAGAWPPLRLEAAPAAIPFPIDVFPPALQSYCREAAAALQAPSDFIGASMLAVAGGAVGQSVNVKVKQSWPESPLLYMLLVARPGKVKTPAIRRVTKPLAEIDQRLRKESFEARQAWEEAKKAHDKDPDNCPPPGPEPPQLRAIVKNITCESLVIVLKDNPRGVLDDPDEATAWFASFNEYKGKGGSDRQFWLSVWSCAPVSVDRKGGREATHIPFPFVTTLAGLPPSMLGSLAEERGRDDGFQDRILFAYPDEAGFPSQRWTEAVLSEAAEQAWKEAIVNLHGVRMIYDADSETERPYYVTFDRQGKAAWVDWYNAHSDETEASDFPETQAGAWSKLRAHAARFALILSRLRWACDPTSGPQPLPIGAQDVRGAVALVNYFKVQLTRVRHEMTGGIGSADARDVLGWIRRKGVATFREADVCSDLRRFRESPDALAAALKALERGGVVRSKDQPHTRGRRPTPAYVVHPDLVRAPENTGNPEIDPPPAVESPDSGIIGIFGRSRDEAQGGGREVIEL